MDAPTDNTMADSIPATPSAPLFRPNKRRKVYRQRAEDTEEGHAPTISQQPETIDDLIANARAQAEENELVEILRLRKQKKSRGGGVEFRAEGAASTGAQTGGELVKREEGDGDDAKAAEMEALQKVVGRFAPQMGVMGNDGIVNKHMISYIDTELAKRRLETSESNATQTPSSLTPSDIEHLQTLHSEQSSKPLKERQPAMLGKLQEIDLGDEVREFNMSRTRKRLNNQSPEPTSRKPPNPKPRPGLGPDGKPWRPRKPRGRNDEDIRRDALVEEVLRENRIELYEEVSGFAPGKGIYDADGTDTAADDRIAEEFKRDFMDAVSARQRKRPVVEGGAAGGKKSVKLTKEEELMKGPKLGGSKSQRAAMREMVLKGEIPPPRVRK